MLLVGVDTLKEKEGFDIVGVCGDLIEFRDYEEVKDLITALNLALDKYKWLTPELKAVEDEVRDES